jgi:hypothetical protein
VTTVEFDVTPPVRIEPTYKYPEVTEFTVRRLVLEELTVPLKTQNRYPRTEL